MPPAAPPTRSSEWRSSRPPQGGPFERPVNRYRQCGPIGSAQDATVGVETAPLSGKGEITKKHGTGPRNAYGAGESLVELPPAGIVSTGPSTKRRRNSATRTCRARSRASSAVRSVAPS